MVYKTKEEKLATRRAWYYANPEKVKEMAKRSREKHKEQRRVDTKKWVENNKEHYKEYHKKYRKKWYQENKEANHKRSRKWAKENPEKMKEIRDRFQKSHPIEIKNYFKKYEKQIKAKFRTTKYNAKRKEFEFNLSVEEFTLIVSKPCIYCGDGEARIGVDRIDNNKGYTKENSAPCCKICNYMKRTMNKKEFLEHIKKIYQCNKPAKSNGDSLDL